MGNHVHLLLQVGVEPIAQFMRRICGSYVYWYNLKVSQLKIICKIKSGPELQKMEKTQRNIYLKKLKDEYNLSIRQIARLTGINRGIVCRA